MNTPNTLDWIYLCTPTPGQLFTNGFEGPPDWVVLPEGETGHHASMTVTTRLPIPKGCLLTGTSAMGNGQSGMRTESPDDEPPMVEDTPAAEPGGVRA